MRCFAKVAMTSFAPMPTGPVMRPSLVMTSFTSVVWRSKPETKRMSRLVTMPTQAPVVVDDGQPRDAVGRAERVDLVDRGVGRRRDRVGDHARLAALDAVDHRRLLLDGEVAVDDADAALAGDGDRHARLGHGVHGTRDERRRDGDAPRDP